MPADLLRACCCGMECCLTSVTLQAYDGASLCSTIISSGYLRFYPEPSNGASASAHIGYPIPDPSPCWRHGTLLTLFVDSPTLTCRRSGITKTYGFESMTVQYGCVGTLSNVTVSARTHTVQLPDECSGQCTISVTLVYRVCTGTGDPSCAACITGGCLPTSPLVGILDALVLNMDTGGCTQQSLETDPDTLACIAQMEAIAVRHVPMAATGSWNPTTLTGQCLFSGTVIAEADCPHDSLYPGGTAHLRVEATAELQIYYDRPFTNQYRITQRRVGAAWEARSTLPGTDWCEFCNGGSGGVYTTDLTVGWIIAADSSLQAFCNAMVATLRGYSFVGPDVCDPAVRLTIG